MGEYADLYDEYSLNNELESSDDPEDIFDEWGIPTINTYYSCENDYMFPIESNFNYSKLDQSLLKMNDEWLMRKLNPKKSLRINQTVTVINITEKAVLFEFNDEWENTYHWQMKGLRFWLPKSVLYIQKNEKKVLYIPKWAKIKIINHI